MTRLKHIRFDGIDKKKEGQRSNLILLKHTLQLLVPIAFNAKYVLVAGKETPKSIQSANIFPSRFPTL